MAMSLWHHHYCRRAVAVLSVEEHAADAGRQGRSEGARRGGRPTAISTSPASGCPTDAVQAPAESRRRPEAGGRAAAAVGRSALQGAHREQRQGSSGRALLAVRHSGEAQHPRRPEGRADAGPAAVPPRVAHDLPAGVHRRPAAAADGRAADLDGLFDRPLGGRHVGRRDHRIRTARPGSTCAACPAPRRCM